MSEKSDLAALVGEWEMRVDLPGAGTGRVAFEWALDGRYLLQRSDAPDPVPNSLSMIAPDGDGYTMHYFDTRGVVRLNRMTLGDGVWTLSRTEPDFSPLHFAQRFEGRFSADGRRIEGRWERSDDGGATWDLDFTLGYTRLG
jgi:hypothetical protein